MKPITITLTDKQMKSLKPLFKKVFKLGDEGKRGLIIMQPTEFGTAKAKYIKPDKAARIVEIVNPMYQIGYVNGLLDAETRNKAGG